VRSKRFRIDFVKNRRPVKKKLTFFFYSIKHHWHYVGRLLHYVRNFLSVSSHYFERYATYGCSRELRNVGMFIGLAVYTALYLVILEFAF